jgi:predicted RNA-binding Zn-ribbon protein involved in translation (DUF1610 family)
MRKFQCYDCKHTWELPHGVGGRGVSLTCPKCGSKNIHRSAMGRGFGWRRSESGDMDTPGRGRGWGRGWGRRRGLQDEE